MYQNLKMTVCDKRKIFKKKRVLQAIYDRWYIRIVNNLNQEGRTLEIGSGFGDFRRACPHCIVSDTVESEWINAVADAHRLPFKAGSIANIVCIDVLHHLSQPKEFFDEAERVLTSEGRIIFVEMYLSLISYPILKLFHFEKIDLIAMATNIFFKKSKQSNYYFKNFKILKKEIHDFLVYPLSGGFNYPSIVPEGLYSLFLKLEDKLRFLRCLGSFKATVVLEKNNHAKRME